MPQRFLDADYAEGSVVVDVRIRRRVVTANLRVRTRELAPQRWDVALALVGGSGLRAAVVAHQARQGLARPFDVHMPQDLKSLGSINQPDLKLHANVAAGLDTLSVSSGAAPGLVKSGQYLRIDGASKVYRVISPDADYSGAVGKPMRIYPALVAAASSGSDKVVLDPLLRAVYSGDLSFGQHTTDQGLADVAVLGLMEYLG